MEEVLVMRCADIHRCIFVPSDESTVRMILYACKNKHESGSDSDSDSDPVMVCEVESRVAHDTANAILKSSADPFMSFQWNDYRRFGWVVRR